MEVECKFDIDDEVYLLKNNKIIKAVVDSVHVKLNRVLGKSDCFTTDIEYTLDGSDSKRRTENELFASREDLIDHMRKIAEKYESNNK